MRTRPGVLLVTIGLAVGSAIAMGLLFHPGYDPTRAYEGTDTRAFTLLIGAALAIAWPSDVALGATLRQRNLLDGAAVLGLAMIVLLVCSTDAFSAFLYPYGFLALSVATVAVVGAVVHPASRVGTVLGWRPLRWVGVRSYGIYLWQWPIIVLATPIGETAGWARGALEVAATLLVAGLSWRYLEEPVRRGALGRLWRSHPRTAQLSPRALMLGSAAFLAAVCGPVLSLAGALPVASASLTATHVTKIATIPHLTAVRSPGGRQDAPKHVAHSNRTSCRSVLYIGDSTSEGENSSEYIPNPRQRLPARLADVGVRDTIPEISGARSIIETFEGQPNAATVAQRQIEQGFRGCWILALGTNEVDNVHDGGPSFQTRIERMMSIIGRQPVLWIDAITLLPPGNPYAEDGCKAGIAPCWPTAHVTR